MTAKFAQILENIGRSTRYNLHSHTQFCDGHAPMEQMVAGAIDAGLEHYGFSPHGPIPIPSPCNMGADTVEAYKAEVERLRRLHKGEIELYTGMEVDFLGPQWGPHSAEVQAYGLDYIIGSVHFVPAQDGTYADTDGQPERFRRYVEEVFGGDLRHVVDTFFRQTISMIEAGGLDIVGHFDKIGLNASCMQPDIEDRPWYARHIADVVDAIAARGLIAEINTKHYARWQRFFPAVRWWPLLRRAGIRVLVNSDAHDPHLTDASRRTALDLWHNDSNS